MTMLWNDIRYGLRMLAKNPGFTLCVVLILALGIAVNTALFSALHGILFGSLPFAHSERIMSVWSRSSSPHLSHFPFMNVSAPDYYDWAEQNTVFAELAAMDHRWLNLTGRDDPRALTGWAVTENFFDVFEKPPVMGRSFVPKEIGPGKAQVAILSHALWQQAFSGRLDIVGQQIMLDNHAYTVVGVAHPDMDFRQDFRVQIYVPLERARTDNRNQRALWVAGRLLPGVTPDQAAAELRTIAARLEVQHPDTNATWAARVIPMRELMFGQTENILLVLYGAAALVLLIACANTAGLWTTRAAARSREMAVRSALGAGRLRLCRAMLVESLLLSLAAGILGFLGAFCSLDLLNRGVATLNRSSGIAGVARISMSPGILAFALGLAVVACAGFGLLPAWFVSQTNPAEALRGSGRSATQGRHHRRLSSGLVIAEIATAFVLLMGACLLLRSLDHLYRTSPGFQPAHLLTLDVTLSAQADYKDSRGRAAFCQNVLTRMQAIPGVLATGSTSALPIAGDNWANAFDVVGQSPSSSNQRPSAEYRTVSKDYFATMSIPLVEGRTFAETDGGTHNVIVVDEELARRYFPGSSPLGREIYQQGRRCEVIGVVGSIQSARMTDREHRPHMYEPLSQYCWTRATFVVKAAGDPVALTKSLRQSIWSVDRYLPVARVQTMQGVVRDSLSMPRLSAVVLGLFAGTALILTLIGIYGIITGTVSQRTREIGIRMTFGARPFDVIKFLMASGLVLIGLGLLAGLAGAVVLCRLLESQLYGISSADPVSYGSVIVFVVTVSLLACVIPALKAARVDPMVALRCE
jgi:putative ABC transport system permease protein